QTAIERTIHWPYRSGKGVRQHGEQALSRFGGKVEDFASKFHDRHGHLPSGPRSPDNTGEPPGGDMLAATVVRLEDDMKEVKSDLRSLRDSMSKIEVQLATISAKLDSKIDYKWMTIYVLGI